MAGCGAWSTSECMGDVGQGTTLPRPSNGYMRPCFTPFVSGAYVLAPPHASTSHLPPEPLSPPLSDISCVPTDPGGSAVAVARGLPWSVWVTLTLVKKIPCPLKLIDIDDKWIHKTMFYAHHQSVVILLDIWSWQSESLCVMCGCVGWIPGLVSRVYG